MTILEQLVLTTVPEKDQPIVDLFRSYIGDQEELNTLKEVKESTDLALYRSLLMQLVEINSALVSEPNYTELMQVSDVNVLFLGALLKTLTRAGIISARNTLTYQDAGGISVQDYDTYGRYINYFNVLLNSYYKNLQAWIVRANTEACYGYQSSEYSQSSRYQW